MTNEQLFLNSLQRQPRCRRTRAKVFGWILQVQAAPLRQKTLVQAASYIADSAVLVSTPLGLGAVGILRHRLVSSAPLLGAA